uniref:Uncharacterized protein n=1 Tax=Lepeophtheirus salmonis TaxID=72036 RepID=A0A0K2V2C3_LEPSM
MNYFFAEKKADYYLDGLERWKHHLEKCVELQGDYVVKYKIIRKSVCCIFVRSETFQTTLVNLKLTVKSVLEKERS